MKPKVGMNMGLPDLIRLRLDQIFSMKHVELVVVERPIDWDKLAAACGVIYSDGTGQPLLPIRLMAGIDTLKYPFELSDEQVVSEYECDQNFLYFYGEGFFQKRCSS